MEDKSKSQGQEEINNSLALEKYESPRVSPVCGIKATSNGGGTYVDSPTSTTS
ncbi:MAG: hypothetical protein WC082_10755 [Victivallales bacterium]